MPIEIICASCQQTLRLRDDLAGQRGKCPKCQAIVEVPARAAPIQSPSSPGSARTKSSMRIVVPASSVKPQDARNAPPELAKVPPAKASSVATAATMRAAAPAQLPSAKPAPLSTAVLSPDQRRNLVMTGFVGQFERPAVSVAYRLGVLLAALFMVLLPIVYVGLICLLGAAIVWHLTHNHVFLGQVRGRAAALAFLLYLAPAFIGGVMILFMIKPLFARPAREPRRRSLTIHSDPLLFDFVERICQLVGAPMPKRIDIDCDVNASASFRRGWLSMLVGRDLVLTIGMPLAAGLTIQQLAGVLAHELGHFSQGTAMRLTYVVRSINFWLVRCVYERDGWDAWLSGAADGADGRIAIFIHAARAGVWLTRQILWVLMFLGHAVAGFLLRQMEFDADRYETRLAGSQTFAECCRRLRLLGFAWQKTQNDMGEYYTEGRLADNLPKLLLHNAQRVPPEVHKLVSEVIEKSETRWFHSHPADKDRIAAALAERAAGAFQSRLPASVLFDNFDAAGKNVTWDFYCSAFGQMINARSLSSTDELLARQEQTEQADDARDRFFAGAFSALRALRLPVMPSGRTHPAAVWRKELDKARQYMGASAAAYRQAVESVGKADKRLVHARQAKSLFMSEVRLQKGYFDQPPASSSQATQFRDQALAELSRLDRALTPFDEAAGLRLRAALILLSDPELAARLPEADAWRREIAALLPVVKQIASNYASVLDLRTSHAVLGGLFDHVSGYERHEPLIREIYDCAQRVWEQLSALRGAFGQTDYPFDHARGKMPISHYLLRMVPPPEEIGAVFDATDQLLGNLFLLNARALSRLCAIAEQVEAALGYEPLPLPPKNAT